MWNLKIDFRTVFWDILTFHTHNSKSSHLTTGTFRYVESQVLNSKIATIYKAPCSFWHATSQMSLLPNTQTVLILHLQVMHDILYDTICYITAFTATIWLVQTWQLLCSANFGMQPKGSTGNTISIFGDKMMDGVAEHKLSLLLISILEHKDC